MEDYIYNLTKLDKNEINNLNRTITSNKIEPIKGKKTLNLKKI